MRRGHASIGGWRNENSRHFKPRNAGPPQFRPNRNFHLQDSLRFPPPLLFREPPFGNRPALLNTPPPDHRDRNKYRHDNRQNNQYRSHFQEQRSVFPIRDHNRHESMEKIGQPITIYNDNNRYYDYSRDVQFGNMEGKDQRKSTTFPKHQEPHNHHSVSHWTYTPDDKKNYENRNSYRHNKYHDTTDNNKISTAEYSGHRPPSSDHYGSNPSSTLDNSSFSRSVDDTVDIIRKRLQNRNEPLQPQEELRDNSNEVDDNMSRPSSSNYQNIQQIQPVKKRIQRQSLNMEANCDKMKNKIVHQLFKMDKDKIHKLMDNPSSSTKFEYALSSLITESQNSLNRHLRSVAEKSLCSSEAFVHNDNNTIYEDTFMKQMQGILDPQDTVLLEDIKPLVLAELSKVLQLDDYDQPFQLQEDQGNYQALNNQQNYDNYDYDNYPQSEYYEQIHSPQTTYEENYENTHIDNIRHEYTPEPEEQKYLFERRPAKINIEHSVERRMSSELRRQLRNSVDTTMSKEDSFCIERRNSRRSTDTKSNDETERSQPLFDTKAEMLSEEEDPFAELDRQYHVAVDPNFIDTYGISSPQQSTFAVAKLPNTRKEINDINLTKEVHDIKKDIDTQLSNIAKSSLKLVATNSSKLDAEKFISSTVSNSATQIELYQETVNVTSAHKHILDTNYQSTVESRIEDDVTYKSEVTPSKTELLSNSRKRSTDQKPSHRKEKRKKSNSLSSDPVKQTLMHDYTSKDKRFDHKETSKEAKSVETADKIYSDKYVKRKETPKKNESEGQKKRQRSVSSSHSIVSPKENSYNNNKVECKKKLKSIDMFIEHPKKVNVHQAHRNTSLPSATAAKVVDTVKAPIIFNRKVTKKHVSIQVTRKLYTRETQTLESKSVSTRFCQTEKRKILSKCTQTDPVTFEKNTVKATDAFERMKQIDMEIQVLLQEKFKLYNSLESNEPYPSTIQSLGMTVLNVASPELKHDEENDIDTLTEDAIVDDFTSIPVEELEQIALESVGNHKSDKKQERKSRRQKILDEQRASSLSPTTRRNAKKIKTPNISLIEQIITDDRPLEDIISLDDLETVSVKTKRQKTRKLQNIPKKKVTKKAKAVKSVFSLDDFTLKECCVVLNRSDVTKYLKRVSEEPVLEPEAQVLYEIDVSTHETTGVVEDATGNDLQFDMLDVSEDIVIGDNCEVKSGDDKYVERNELANTEEVILDNSQCIDPQQSNINQGENICKMYDYSADENLRRDSITVSGHADAVLAIESIENNFIAACLDGNVYYFNFDGQLLATLRGSNLAVTCLTIVKEKYGTTVYTGSLDSRIRYYDLETGLEKGPECNVLSPIQTMDRAWDTIFVGTRTGFVLQFECKNNMLIPVSTVKFSDQSILALRAMKEGPRKVLLVAARSEDVTIRDAQTGLLLRTLQGPKMTVYTLLYEDGKIYCGTSSHQIHVYDYTSGSHSGVHEGGKGAVCLRATGGLLFAGCYDGCVYVYREGEPQPLAQLRGPSLMLLSLAVVGSKIIAGYKDRSLYIWKIPLSILQEMIL